MRLGTGKREASSWIRGLCRRGPWICKRREPGCWILTRLRLWVTGGLGSDGGDRFAEEGRNGRDWRGVRCRGGAEVLRCRVAGSVSVAEVLWEDDEHQGEEIESFVEEVMRKICDKRVDVPENLVEDYRQIKAIIEKLDVDSSGVRFIGIHGMGGIGKTTLAKVVFNKLCFGFDDAFFLNDIREATQHGLINLQKKLLSGFCGSRIVEHIKDIGDGMQLMKKVFRTKKVLIVLDNLDKKEQLEKLVGKSNWFNSGSRIIITTRDKGILMTQMESSSKEDLSQPEGILDYEVHGMGFDQALQLFSKHTFGSDSPMEDYVALSKAIVDKVDRLPLAVEVIGSLLYCCSSTLEPHFDKRNLWKDTLKKLDRGPFKDVRDILMISYEGLENEQKEVFLDIACFFTNEEKTYPIIMWDNCNYNPHIAIPILLQRSLIKIGDDNKFWMHDQVRDLGRYIILKEYPHKFSRVWIHEDVVKLLESKERKEDVKALSLTYDGHSIAPKELAALPNLRFLRVKGIDIKELPSSIGEMEMLVKLDLSHSGIVKLPDSIGYLEKLEVIGIAGWQDMDLAFPQCLLVQDVPDF
ncbi:TMV resistance protein N-like [Eucalyptus grandis]|uniref:TMV resistance protein N-like n=1 Tax=Eucalyptus grandis TaxID=71139 RepID=UPI00192ED237|nr:TMV resistance protein N-like [Eucalyptus grandis]